MQIGENFNNIISLRVLGEISCAMTSLYADLVHVDKEVANEIVIEMTQKAKKLVNCYIEEQRTTLLKLIDLS
jgi:hypothetical protein